MHTLRRCYSLSHTARIAVLACLITNGLTALGQTDAPDVKFSVVRTSSAGIRAYVPGKWGLLQINLLNTRDEPRELLCATYFDGSPNVQFGRRVWLPPKSRLQMSQPVMIPKIKADDERSLNFHSLLLDAHTATEVLHRDDTGQLLQDGAVLVTHNSQLTALIDEINEEENQNLDDVRELIAACRVDQELTKQVTHLSDPFLADDEQSLQALDHLIVAGNRLANDARAFTAVRNWLYGGGRMWVMLDRTDPRILELLIGDEFRCHLFDRVGLTTVQILPTIDGRSNTAEVPTDYEVPVDFVRVTVTNADVTHTVNGWPAAFTLPCGRGRLLVTTLGARAWMRPRQGSSRPGKDTPFSTIPVMEDLADLIMVPRPSELFSVESLESQAGEYIGYSIPSRGLIIGLQIGLLLLIAGLGIGLYRSGRTEHLGWCGPLLTIAVSMVLLLIGRSNRHSITDTIATVRHLQAIPGTDDFRVQGVAAVYRSEGSSTPIHTESGGRLIPDMSRLDGNVRRMVWTDQDSWTWENVPQQAGQQSASFSTSGFAPQPIRARATFGPEGLVGKIEGVTGVADAILATRDGRVGIKLQADNTFVARAENVFENEQFLGAGLLSDEQDRRRRTLEKLFTDNSNRDYPERPLVLAWTSQSELRFEFGHDLQAIGSTLMSIPLILERPTGNAEFVIPSPLLPYRNARSPDGTPSSAMWSQHQKKWQERHTPSSAWLRFQLPSELLPLNISRGRVTVQVTGPVGRLELLGLHHGQAQSIQTIIDPVGTLSFEIADSDLLRVTNNGEVLLGLHAGDPRRPELTTTKSGLESKINYWRIESLSLQLWATTTDHTAKD